MKLSQIFDLFLTHKFDFNFIVNFSFFILKPKYPNPKTLLKSHFFCSSFFKNKSSKRGTFYFTHSGTILKFLAFLKLYRDPEPLTSDNFDRLKDERLWRTSRIDAFGSNVAFVLKSCDSTQATKGQTGPSFYYSKLRKLTKL